MDEEKDLPIRRAQSRYPTIVCSFCVANVDDACFSWASGVCICRKCLEFATEEVSKAKKTTEVVKGLKKIETKLTKVQEAVVEEEVSRKTTIQQIQQILSGTPMPDDVA